MTPASPNTYIVSRQPNSSEGFIREPVIGYVYASADNKPPTVVTLQGQRRLIGEDAVLFPCGMVVDPLNGYSFASTEEWLEFVPAKRPGEDEKPSQKKPEPEADPSPNTEGYDIEWTNKSFKNNSFWHYDDGEFEFCFILPGEEDAPKQTQKCQKIKRTELDELKKTIDVLELDDVKNPNVLPDAEPEDEEEPGDYEDEEDDGGLI